MNAEQLKKLEDDLWQAANNLRDNTGLKSHEYAAPVLGLIFLKFADNAYNRKEQEINAEYAKHSGKRSEKIIEDIAIEKCGLYLPKHARYDYLLNLSEQEDIATAIKQAMKDIEKYKPELADCLPKDDYVQLVKKGNVILFDLLRAFADIPHDASGDILGKIYEFFLAKFALAEGQGGGEFYTPTSVVKLMVEIIEPHKGTVYDPACGSGGMFVQSQKFVQDHRKELEELGELHEEDQLFIYGQEKSPETVKLARMNIAVNGLKGLVAEANSYTDDPFDGFKKFDYVMANPPFNATSVPYLDVKDDKRFNTFGIPRKKGKVKVGEEGKETVPNGNYLWINLFATSLKEKGRAALVMANSASDARHSEADIRKTLIKENLIYGMLTLPSNMFYTVTLPATLWFFDKDKKGDRLLFIDARNTFTQIDRAHREFNEEQIQNIALISKLHKGNRLAFIRTIDTYFKKGVELLEENYKQVKPVSEQLIEVLNDEQGKIAVGDLVSQWKTLTKLKESFSEYIKETNGRFTTQAEIETLNKTQHTLREIFDPFFDSLHTGLKQLDKTVRKHEKSKADIAKAKGKRATIDKEIKQLKQALNLLHKEVKNAESYFKHILWLQERFPKAEYEDVIGLCKLATQKELAEQDYSLNPGRYVGVVIEEDGKTEEEFLSGITELSEKFENLSQEATDLEIIIKNNIDVLIGN
ncbi:N-6 DNA methylase [Pseudoalteromonas sp. 20-92]|uniref:type I restriction-modification system subunit M n=1 Tax=Pseudoalteromonas sp. 20-92 TaxID=2969394 RepID=UPI0027B13DB7|nr:N-6 DNA methylase [Pseudoalteromonas sp. 20-92]MDQ2043316.1 N-6 DNA methylase [Pseudoalteromonas sp. 20-92]